MRGAGSIAGLLLAGVIAAGCSAASSGSEGGDDDGNGDGDSSAAVDTIFFEDFEGGSLARWTDRGRPERHLIVTEPSLVRRGTGTLQITYPQGEDGGWLTAFFLPGYDSLRVRFALRLEPAWEGGTKLVSFYGSRIDDQWSAAGKASVCPSGSDFFVATITTEPRGGNPPPLRFYTYYPLMPREPDGRTCYGSYGLQEPAGARAEYTPAQFVLTRGEWHDIEYRVRLDLPGGQAAAQEILVDGVRRAAWEGIRLRSSTDLRLNALTITASAAFGAPRTQRLWIDDVVVTHHAPRVQGRR